MHMQLNSETDFVARNDLFQAAARNISNSALTSFAAGANGSLSSSLFPSSGSGAVVSAADPVKLAALVVVNPATVGAGAAAMSAADTVTDLVSKIRENIVLRRAGALVLSPPAAAGGAAASGVIGAYMHNLAGPGVGSIGVLVGLEATPSSAGAGTALPPTTQQALSELARKVAMHAAAAKPLYGTRAEVPADVLERERAVLRSMAAASGKPEAIVAKMVEGRLAKFYADNVLADQPYVLSEAGAPVSKALEEARKALGLVTLRIAGFLSFSVGETAAPAAPAEDVAAAALAPAAPSS